MFTINGIAPPTESIDSLRVYEVTDIPQGWPVLYRALGDMRGEFMPYSSIWIAAYKVLSYTAQGVWIDVGAQGKKFVHLKADRKWACLTKREAVYSFSRRKTSQLRHLNSALTIAEANLQHALALLKES